LTVLPQIVWQKLSKFELNGFSQTKVRVISKNLKLKNTLQT